MRKNKAKEIIKNGKAVINGWLQIPSTVSAETMAQQGWDSLTIDMQHGLVDYTNAMPMMQVISATEVVPLARVNWNEPKCCFTKSTSSFGICWLRRAKIP